jgi:hypothetical protein
VPSFDNVTNFSANGENSRPMPNSAEHGIESIDFDDIRAAVSNLVVGFILPRNDDGRLASDEARNLWDPARDGASPAQKDEEIMIGLIRHQCTSLGAVILEIFL